MRKSRAKLPSPALVVALVALFVALGGSAYAVNKVGTKEIKNGAITAAKLKKNAVTAAKIKGNAVTTAKIQNNAVTGAKINEGTLGSVPSATNAVNAENAANLNRYLATGLKKASVGQTVTLLTVGPFTITGKCKDEGSGYVSAKSFIATSQVGSNLYSYNNTYYENNFNPGNEAELSYEAFDDSPYIQWGYSYGGYTEFRAASADGSTLLNGEIVNAVFVHGSQCAWWGYAANSA